MDSLAFLSRITIMLFLGLIAGLVAKKLRLPTILLLIITGAALNTVYIDGAKLFEFSDNFLISSSILALVLVVFEGSSRFTLRELDNYSEAAMKIAIIFLVLNMLFLSFATKFIFGIHNILLCLLFAAVMSGTDPGSILSLFHSKSNKIIDILKFESVINTPIVVLIPFIILNLMELDSGNMGDFVGYFYPFLQQIITGIGTGVVIGLIVFRFMRHFYSQRLSPITLVVSALLTYILAQSLGGNGVLAVTVLGVFFGNIAVKGKEELQTFSNMLSNLLEMLVFILIGFMIPLNIELGFLLRSILLFIIMLVLRFFAIQIVFMHDHVNINERIFMALNCTKDIAVSVVAFILTTYVLEIPILENGIKTLSAVPFRQILGANTVIDLIILFIVYSIIVSSVIAHFSKHFIRIKAEE